MKGAALARAEAERAYQKRLSAWRQAVVGSMGKWDALVLRASTSAADVAVLDASPLTTVARAVVRAALYAD